jgi:hypothetical protein
VLYAKRPWSHQRCIATSFLGLTKIQLTAHRLLDVISLVKAVTLTSLIHILRLRGRCILSRLIWHLGLRRPRILPRLIRHLRHLTTGEELRRSRSQRQSRASLLSLPLTIGKRLLQDSIICTSQPQLAQCKPRSHSPNESN